MSPAYQYNVGEIIETHDDQIGMIISRTNACDYMGFNHNVKERVIRSYAHIAIYKTLIGGKISYVNESNIRGIFECEEKTKEKL